LNYWNTITELDHDYMVRELVSYLDGNGFVGIQADIVGYNHPELIYWQNTGNGHIPDVVAQKNRMTYLFEVETVSTLTSEHSKSQRLLFTANAKEHGKFFVLVVQASAKTDAELLLQQEGLPATVWTVG